MFDGTERSPSLSLALCTRSISGFDSGTYGTASCYGMSSRIHIRGAYNFDGFVYRMHGGMSKCVVSSYAYAFRAIGETRRAHSLVAPKNDRNTKKMVVNKFIIIIQLLNYFIKHSIVKAYAPPQRHINFLVFSVWANLCASVFFHVVFDSTRLN